MKNENLDVIIIGAGLSGIGSAVHLQMNCPDQRYTILEMRSAMGGTWDLFRYPGVRSDSDMYTLGYKFKPWTNPKAIADGHDIRNYIRETALEYGVNNHIRYHHKVTGLSWSSDKARWTIRIQHTDSGKESTLECKFVICCSGYYKYENGYTPEFAGRDNFRGQIIHPQFWPEELDYSDKRIVVIGSGATAVTLLPSLAEKAKSVTMLQRSPGYVANVPEKGVLANSLRKYLPEKAVYTITRASNIALSIGFYNLTQAYPSWARRFLTEQVEDQLEGVVDIKHFTPRYNVWDERLCAVPDGDLFAALRGGKASVVTDHIDRFVEEGILLKSGQQLDADIIVTATGLDLQVLGGAQLSVDGTVVSVPEKHYYKGAMLEDVPNLAMIFGYTNSSWTLKSDLIAEYICRILKHMSNRDYDQCVPRHQNVKADSLPFINLSSGYIQRAAALVPRQGEKHPWKLYQNYFKDYAMLKLAKIDDRFLEFSSRNSSSKNDILPKSTKRKSAS
ncbi:NAD(P)/FAD-dependent oxidoreductase [Acinetobacter modestus]|uniref:flavin-containing monooxygenase n=1 Tax=Acinetobacter modestus TaxID=1776740 RepID=UPI002030E8BD|nr:NAD(P)/FAD-dependent oxidoreductase [Acinetobacter modestus]MCM1959080.1 NAD(P)/FAD-dependent oxidoreductase [Acinetobacter modestus]